MKIAIQHENENLLINHSKMRHSSKHPPNVQVRVLLGLPLALHIASDYV